MTARAKVPVQKSPEFPPLCCGACHHSHPIEKVEHFMCFVDPPMFVAGDAPYWLRGRPVDPHEPECEKFKPRCHS